MCIDDSHFRSERTVSTTLHLYIWQISLHTRTAMFHVGPCSTDVHKMAAGAELFLTLLRGCCHDAALLSRIEGGRPAAEPIPA